MILLLAFLSGVCGRAGGASKTGKWYDFFIDSITRDLGCSIIFALSTVVIFGYHHEVAWIYPLMVGLHWLCFSTYWDDCKNKMLNWIHKKINWMYPKDNLWLSGFMVGLCAFPIMFISLSFWWIVALRAAILMILWGCLNKYLPQKGILIWRRDVVEEFSRYFVSL